MKSRRAGAVMLLGFLIFSGMNLTGCTNKDKHVRRYDVCPLVKKAEVERILGQSIQSPQEVKSGISMCRIITNGKDTPITITLSLIPLPANTTPRSYYKQYVSDMKSNLRGWNEHSITKYQDIGDLAFWDETISQLTVLQKHFILNLAGVPSEKTNSDIMQRIAQNALSRLPQ